MSVTSNSAYTVILYTYTKATRPTVIILIYFGTNQYKHMHALKQNKKKRWSSYAMVTHLNSTRYNASLGDLIKQKSNF